ncbi:MAG: glyoxalase [candidate division Zixibacteria bacterium RBG_16_50_21]|nr:MAG: glyoxalase [candidate division Zixibacteria bacterium RBG_16_50_21]
MAAKPIPDNFHTVTPHLIIQGVGKLIDFMKQAFEAKEIERVAQADGSIMHTEVKIGDSIIMTGEVHSPWEPKPGSLYLNLKDTDATYKWALEAGATSVMEPADQFYGDRNDGVKDPCGNFWWIATRIDDVSPEELKKRAETCMKKQAG